ncbi:hypothetical protein [Planctopirus hydrillae]|uniref:Uncharacterized protein n=1 Tax=Planctopirus hydrillae TaxID=1841610 RepID=A0A1C3E408_9PLAN|nr:hypothetical protein [Planctopirus hydrillae]ODA27976.1 hypothetical protein A6X21_13965 [Planctopirus hydrillae]
MEDASQESQTLTTETSLNSWRSMGWFLLLAGSVLLLLNALESVESLDWMPSIWFMNRTLWWMIAILMAGGGLYTLSTVSVGDEDDEHPSE